MNDKSMWCGVSVISMLVVFLLTPFHVSAEEESPEAVTVGDIPVAQDATAISSPVIDYTAPLVTGRLYPSEFKLAKVTLTLTNNPTLGGGMIAYRFSPYVGWQGIFDDNTAVVDIPGETSNKLWVKFANEDGHIRNITEGNDTYHVVYIQQPSTSSASFDIVVSKAITFKHAGQVKISFDYSIYTP